MYKMVSLPNIISGKLIVPEIIQGNVNADNISYNIEKYSTILLTEKTILNL